MTYKTIVVTPPAYEPVDLAECYRQLKIDAGFDDDHVCMLRSIARDKAENYCNRFFTEQTIKIVFSGGFDTTKIDLPYPDLAAVNSITYIDSSNVEQTITPSDYAFFSDMQVIYPVSSFPADAKSYTVEVDTAPPEELGGVKIGILMMLTDLYELRTESVIGFSVANNPAVSNSLYPYRVQLGV